jgi:choline dehydrogenase
VLGGSSGINGMIWVHGDPQEYDRWRDQFGAAGWGWDALAPLFRGIESYPRGDPRARGRDGPVKVTEYGPREPLMDAFIEACVQAGIPRTDDYNDGCYQGVGMLQFNTDRGLRCSTREAYLRPARGRPNLVVRTGALAHRVLFEGRRAVGVEYRHRGAQRIAHCAGDVVLSAGAIQSPQLLELSGIGDPTVLGALGIPVRHALPAVGTNLRDHPHTRLSYEARNVRSLNTLYPSLLGKARMAARFAWSRDGLMSCCAQIAHALVRTDPADPQPDVKIQLHWLSSPDARDPRRYVLDPHPGVSVGTFMLRPRSSGTVHLRSPDPAEAPRIVSNYFTDPSDRRAALAAIRLARAVVAQPSLAGFIVGETRPGPQADTDEALFDFATSTAQTSYHPIGTCRMGGDPASVVDARLRVRGVDGLRVADASVMPTMPSSNTNAPAIVVGEKAARMIVEDARAAPAIEVHA